MDVVGRAIDSPTFERIMFDGLEEGGSRLSFVIGGAEGLPPQLQPYAPEAKNFERISLSKMTFTHLMARALLAEQIYRAAE